MNYTYIPCKIIVSIFFILVVPPRSPQIEKLFLIGQGRSSLLLNIISWVFFTRVIWSWSIWVNIAVRSVTLCPMTCRFYPSDIVLGGPREYSWYWDRSCMILPPASACIPDSPILWNILVKQVIAGVSTGRTQWTRAGVWGITRMFSWTITARKIQPRTKTEGFIENTCSASATQS